MSFSRRLQVRELVSLRAKVLDLEAEATIFFNRFNKRLELVTSILSVLGICGSVLDGAVRHAPMQVDSMRSPSLQVETMQQKQVLWDALSDLPVRL